jgi:hypothetical protein
MAASGAERPFGEKPLTALRMLANSNCRLLYRHFGRFVALEFAPGFVRKLPSERTSRLVRSVHRHGPIWRFELVRENHRCDVAILGPRFGRRKWRERTGAAQDFERLAIEQVVA